MTASKISLNYMSSLCDAGAVCAGLRAGTYEGPLTGVLATKRGLGVATARASEAAAMNALTAQIEYQLEEIDGRRPTNPSRGSERL